MAEIDDRKRVSVVSFCMHGPCMLSFLYFIHHCSHSTIPPPPSFQFSERQRTAADAHHLSFGHLSSVGPLIRHILKPWNGTVASPQTVAPGRMSHPSLLEVPNVGVLAMRPSHHKPLHQQDLDGDNPLTYRRPRTEIKPVVPSSK